MNVRVAENKQKSSKEQRKRLLKMTEAQAALTWGAILALAALVGAIYLYQTSRIATVGREVQSLQNELDEVKRENANLERDIAEAQSLEKLQKAAEQLGFVRAQSDDVEYLVIPNYPLGAPEETSIEPTPIPVPVESIQEAIWLSFRAGISDLVRGESP